MKKNQQNLIASNSKTPRKHINIPTPIQQTNQQTKDNTTTTQQHQQKHHKIQ